MAQEAHEEPQLPSLAAAGPSGWLLPAHVLHPSESTQGFLAAPWGEGRARMGCTDVPRLSMQLG
eukprot:scaffold12461_cov13-Tisochrysis_lutea.AAC.1